MCVVEEGGGRWGGAGGGKEAYLKDLKQGGMKRSGPQSSSYFKYAPSHLHSSLVQAGRWGLRRAQHSGQQGGSQRTRCTKGGGSFLIRANKIVDEFK